MTLEEIQNAQLEQSVFLLISDKEKYKRFKISKIEFRQINDDHIPYIHLESFDQYGFPDGSIYPTSLIEFNSDFIIFNGI